METIFAITLFLLYAVLWKIKQIRLMRATGVDANVMRRSTSAVQKYFSHFTSFLTIYGILVISAHAANIQIGSLFSRIESLSLTVVDIVGFFIGLFGLSLCFYSQNKMGASWRVGIDETSIPSLVTTGLYGFIRNPTYLGLFLLNFGVWLIWPTWTIFMLNLLFVFFLEIQVRCEEDHLSAIHGVEYDDYVKKTKRYLPFIY